MDELKFMEKLNVKNFISSKKIEIAVGLTFLILLIIFMITSPQVFLGYRIYNAVFTSLPILIILSTSLVFVVSAGEIDLSFPSVIGIGALVFSSMVAIKINTIVSFIAAIAAGAFIGFINGILISKLNLSSLILTLGMNFFLRGFINIVTNGMQRSLLFLKGTSVFYTILVGNKLGQFPIQMVWAIVWVIFIWLLFYRHKFGGQVLFVGDNTNSAREMGVNVDKIKILTFVLVGIGAGLSGVFIVLINNMFTPATGDGYLLYALAALFIGGTPTWGGKGTIFGAIIGSFILGFLDSGIIGAGLTGHYTKFFYGLIMILALISHRFAGQKKL